MASKKPLSETHPDLSAQWHPTKNDSLTPDDVIQGSSRKVWWLCDKGHEWDAIIANRTRGTGCPYCWGHRPKGPRKISDKYNLDVLYPDLTKEWHPTKNGTQTPSSFTPGSHTKVWWQCKNGHEWKAVISNRTQGNNCPYCAGKKASDSYNLRSCNPEIASQWHPTKNSDLRPKDVTPGSGRKVWWICDRGHEWQTTVSHRTRGHNCPECNTQTSRLEVRVYCELNSLFDHVLWRSKQEGFELDIYLGDENIGIEIDGGYWHQSKINQDEFKNEALREMGITVVRLRGEGLQKIASYDSCYKKREQHITVIQRLLRGLLRHSLFCKESSNLVKDYIFEGKYRAVPEYRRILKYLPGPIPEKSLLILKPDIAQDWHPTKNSPLTPSMFSVGSKVKVWWQCEKGHEWEAHIYSRTKDKGTNCPYCTGRIAFDEYSLQLTHPDIANEWNTERNKPLTPYEVVPGSQRKVWWKCTKGHEWQAVIGNRTGQKQGCPYCSNKRVCKDNCLTVVHPELAAQWHTEKNGYLTPDVVVPGTKKNIWWVCEKGHEWRAPVHRRTLGIGCPYCSGRRASSERNLAVVNPELAAEWQTEKNGTLLPEQVTPTSHKRVWWRCDQGHEWNATVNSRSKGTGCPICNPKGKTPRRNATKSYNLATEFPEVALEWHYEKNGESRPTDYTPGSGKKAWWVCKEGHEWQAIIQSRSRGSGCPYCSGRRKSVH